MCLKRDQYDETLKKIVLFSLSKTRKVDVSIGGIYETEILVNQLCAEAIQ